MAYASISHVLGLCPARAPFSATSLPSATQVAQFLDERAGELDALMLAVGYALPVPAAATIALKVLERANALGAWADVEASAQVSEDRDRAEKAWGVAYARLDPEQKGPTIQLDIGKDSTEVFARGRTFAEACIATAPVFSLDMEL